MGNPAFTGIGLKMQLPHWKADMQDQAQTWSLGVYPVGNDPHQVYPDGPHRALNDPAIQHLVLLSAQKLSEAEYAGLCRQFGTNAPGNRTAFPHTTQRSNQFWIAIHRDVYGASGSVYKCQGLVQRISKERAERLKVTWLDAEKLAAQVWRVFDSIEVSTNATKTP